MSKTDQEKLFLAEIETNAVHKHDKYQGMSEQFRLHEKNFLRDKVLGNFEHFAKPTDKDISRNIYNDVLGGVMSNPSLRDKSWFATEFLPDHIDNNLKNTQAGVEESTGLTYDDYYSLYDSEHIIKDLKEEIRNDYVNERTVENMSPKEIDKVERGGAEYANDMIKKLQQSTFTKSTAMGLAGKDPDIFPTPDAFSYVDVDATPYLHESEKFNKEEDTLFSKKFVDTRPPREAFTPLGQIFYDQETSDQEYKKESVNDLLKASGQIWLALPALPAMIEDGITWSEDKILGQDKSGFISNIIHHIPAVDSLFDISRLALNFSNDEIFEKKALFKDNPTLDFVYGMWGTLNQFAKMQTKVSMAKRKKEAGLDWLGKPGVVPEQIDLKMFDTMIGNVNSFDNIIYADKVFFLDNFLGGSLSVFGKRQRALRKKHRLWEYSSLGPYGYKNKLVREHFWANSAFVAGSGAFQYGHNNWQAMADVFDTPGKEMGGQLGAGLLAIITSGLFRGSMGYVNNKFEEMGYFLNPTRPKTYEAYLKEVQGYTDNEIKRLTTSQMRNIVKIDKTEKKAHDSLAAIFDHTKRTDPEQYALDVGFAQAAIQSNKELMEWAEYGLGRPLTKEEEHYFQLRTMYVLDSGVLSEVNNLMKENTNLGMQAKLPKGSTLNALRSEWQERLELQKSLAEVEVKALDGIFAKYTKDQTPPRVLDAMKQYASNELKKINAYMVSNARNIEADATLFKTQYKSIIPIEGVQERLNMTDIQLPDPDLLFTRSRLTAKLLENNLDKYPSGDLAKESDNLFKTALNTALGEKNKAYAKAEIAIGSQPVSLEDPTLQNSFNNIRLRKGVRGDEQNQYTLPENIVEAGGEGLATQAGVAREIQQKGTIYNLKDIYFNAQLRVLSQYKSQQDLLGLQRYLEETYEMNPRLGNLNEKPFMKKNDDGSMSEVNYLSLNASELESVILSTIKSPVVTGPGEITVSDLNRLESFLSNEAFKNSVGLNPNYTNSKYLYESANDINEIIQAATNVILEGAVKDAGAVLNKEEVINNITTYQDAANTFYEKVALPFRRGIGKTGTEQVAGGDYKVPRSDLFMQFVKSPSPYEAKLDFNRIFPEEGPLRDQAVSLLNANIARSIQDEYAIPSTWIDTFEPVIGSDTANDLQVLQNGFNANVIDERRKEALGRVKTEIQELSKVFVDRPTELASQIADIKGENPTQIYETMKNYSPDTVVKLVDDIFNLPASQYDFLVDDMIEASPLTVTPDSRNTMKRSLIAQDLLGAYVAGFREDNVAFGNLFVNKKEAAGEGFKEFRQIQLKNQNSSFHYIFNPDKDTKAALGGNKGIGGLQKLAYNQYILGQGAEAFLTDQGPVLNALAEMIYPRSPGAPSFTDNIHNILGQGKLRETVNSYTAKALGGAQPQTLGSVLAKMFAVLRGVVSLKWIVTDTTIRAMQRNRLKTIGKIIESPALAATVSRTLAGESLNAKDLLTTGHFIRAYFAIDYNSVSDEELQESLQKVLAPQAHIDKSFLRKLAPVEGSKKYSEKKLKELEEQNPFLN